MKWKPSGANLYLSVRPLSVCLRAGFRFLKLEETQSSVRYRDADCTKRLVGIEVESFLPEFQNIGNLLCVK